MSLYLYKIFKALISVICLLIFLALPLQVMATIYSKEPLTDEQFLLLDVKNKNLRFLEAIDAYKVDEQILIPVVSLLLSLEMNIIVSNEDALIKLIQDDNVIEIDLINQTQIGISFETQTPIYWNNNEDELLVSHLLIEALIAADLTFNMNQLLINIKSESLFPVERRLIRENKQEQALKQVYNINGSSKVKFFADEFILDTYQLISAPHANINLNTTANGQKSDSSDIRTASSIQSNFDLLYHNAAFTLNKQANGDIATNLTFKRHQASPYESFPFGIQQYSFGDVFGKADNLALNNQAGIGINIAKRPVNYSRKFGSITIEDIAPPSWEVELYRGGVLLEASTVPADGRYIFEDVETIYGVNRFEVKLYGPYGEERIHHKEIKIDSTQLKKHQFGFDSYILDGGKKMLGGTNNESGDFSPDTFGFAYDYGLSDNFTLGLNLAQKKDENAPNQKFIGTELITSLPGALVGITLSHQLDNGYAGILNISGRVFGDTTYQLNYEKSSDYSKNNSITDSDLISASFSGRILNLNYNNQVAYNNTTSNKNFSASNRLSGNIGNLSLSHNLIYQNFKFSNKLTTETLIADITLAGRLTSDFRISGGFNYDLKDQGKVNLFKLNSGYRISERLNLNTQLDYNLTSETKWRMNSSLSWSGKNATFYSSASYDAHDQWTVGLGLTFSLGYDHHNSNWLMNAQNMAAAGTLDINSYLDINNNHNLDEGDIALPGVKFGPLKQWQDIQSNKNGKAILPFVSTYNAASINPSWADGVTPSTPSYSVYTHPGSRIKAQIPFTVKTTVVGFAMFDDADGEPLTSTNILLKNKLDIVVREMKTDEDGFYEFIDIEPGRYDIFIDPKELSTRTLKSSPGKLEFNTPHAGGYFELGVIAAVPKSRTGVAKSKKVEPTIDNYEPIEELQNLLGIDFFASKNNNKIEEKETKINLNTEVLSQQNDSPLIKQQPNNQVKDTVISIPMLQSSKVIATKPPELKISSVINNYKPEKQTISNRGNIFALQLALYSTAESANDFISKLARKNLTAIKYYDQKASGFRVLMGPFNTKADAWLKSNELRQQAISSFIRSWPTENSSEINKDSNSNNITFNGFSIQLMVAKNQHSINAVINKQQLGDDLYQIKKQENNQELIVLLKGHYQNKKQAQQAVNNLPKKWRDNSWIRTSADLI
jgi:septal ring-binding cell division protein DamX